VGETVAALVAERAAAASGDPVVARELARIAQDEGRHAALAWRTVSWLLESVAPRRRAAIGQSLRAAARALAPVADASTRPDPQSAALALAGRLDAAAIGAARLDAWRDVIAPTLEALLAPTAAADDLRA
jgi:hypothetical protein